jgi:hypothetical protein
MYRKILLIVAAVLGVAMAAPGTASARGFGRGGFHGGFRGSRGFGFAAPAIGLGLGLGLGYGLYGGYPYYGYGGYPYDGYGAYGYGYGGRGCWRRHVIHTAYGPRVRRVWVCG